MIELLIMRHAKSAWDTGDVDFDRPLNRRGERDATRMARSDCRQRSRSRSGAFVVRCSRRATALAVVVECAIDRAFVDFDRELYHAEVDTWLAALRRTPPTTQPLLICGHNPGLDDLVFELARDRPRLTADGKLMTTAAVAHFRFEAEWFELEPRTGQLLSLTRPREL